MSFASSQDCGIRPEDRAFKTLFPSVKDSTNAFDEYLNEDIYDYSDQDSNEELSEALTGFLERTQSTDSRSGFSPIVAPARRQASSPQPWRKGLWCMNQNLAATPDIAITKTRQSTQQRRTSLKRTYDGAEKQAFFSPRSPPATPSSKGRKNFATSLMTPNPHSGPYSPQQPFSREATLSPSPMYAQLQLEARVAHQDSWQQDFQNFHLRLPDEGALPPSLSGRIPQQKTHTGQLNAAIAVRNGKAVQHHGYQNIYPMNRHAQLVQHGCPALNSSLLDPLAIGQAISSPGDKAVYASQHQGQTHHGLPMWTTESLESSDESRYSYNSLQSLEKVQLVQEHPWQSPELSANNSPIQEYTQQYYYPIIAQPTPYRPTHELIQQHHPIHTEGLGIHSPPSAALSPSSTNDNITNSMQAYPSLPPPPTYAFTNEDPFGTPRRPRRRSLSTGSPSPCISPTNTTRTLRKRSPTHHSSPTRNRRKSIGNAGPIIHTPAPPMPKTPKMPRTPTGHGVADFINLTPKDSAKLLSDVAPSGSSKTRARREAEAKDKRKRLSEAAVKAVRRAGGDVMVLKAEGLY